MFIIMNAKKNINESSMASYISLVTNNLIWKTISFYFQARKIFDELCAEEFLPRAPNPEDIIFDDGAKATDQGSGFESEQKTEGGESSGEHTSTGGGEQKTEGGESSGEQTSTGGGEQKTEGGESSGEQPATGGGEQKTKKLGKMEDIEKTTNASKIEGEKREKQTEVTEECDKGPTATEELQSSLDIDPKTNTTIKSWFQDN